MTKWQPKPLVASGSVGGDDATGDGHAPVRWRNGGEAHMALRDIADRIANTTSVWGGPEEGGDGWLTWRASQRVRGEP